MSLDFSQKYDAPIVTTSLTPQDDGEVSLRPKLLADYTGQEKAKGNPVSYTHLLQSYNCRMQDVYLLTSEPGGKLYFAAMQEDPA